MALIEFQNNIGNNPLNSDLKKTFDKIVGGLMNFAVNQEFSEEKNKRLLTFMEIVSSQEIINSFLLKREIAGNSELYKLVEEEQYTRSYLTYLKKEFLKSKSESVKQQIFEKEIELRKINEQLIAHYKQRRFFTTPSVELSTIKDKNIVKFKVSGDELFKIRLYNGKVSYQKIINYSTLKQETEAYLSLINHLETPINTIKKQGEALYKKLFTDDFSTGIPTVIIPDDILHYLPFELLVNNSQYLIENQTISYAPNFYLLNANKTTANNSKNKKAVFFAPKYSGKIKESMLAVRSENYSLQGAEEEVKEISKFVPGEIYLGDLASKTNFKSLEKNISILHLAMHSNLNDEDSELSNLVFSNSEQDYEMYISELYGLNFNADLAVLSACNTGIGSFKDGGNLVSMHRAFSAAGISATVASLWNASDQSTKEIMVAFYKNLQNGQDKATALQQAKLSYLKNTEDEKLQHPFYWAAFVLSGDEEPIQLMKNSVWKEYRFVLAGVALLAGIVLFLRMRRK